MLSNSRWTRGTLNSVERVIGDIVSANPYKIYLTGDDESKFAQVRHKFRNYEAAMEEAISRCWEVYPINFSSTVNFEKSVDLTSTVASQQSKPSSPLPQGQQRLKGRGRLIKVLQRNDEKQEATTSRQPPKETVHANTTTALDEEILTSPHSRPSQTSEQANQNTI